MTDREPPKQLVRDLLRDSWSTTDTFGLKPNIKYGWFDDYDGPYILVLNPDENPLGGGETGWTGRTASGPWREVDGTVELHAFASDEDMGSASTAHGNEYLWGADAANDGTLGDRGVVKEIERILGENEVEPTNPITGNQPVRFLSIGPSNPVPEGERTGVTFHHSIDCGYIYGDG